MSEVRLLADRFEISGHVAAGGMGEILSARDLQSGQQVAIKVLLDELLTTPGMRRRFAEEAKVLRAVQQPGIPRLVAVGKTVEQAPFIAMEWIEGRTLAQLVYRERPLTLGRVVALGDQLLGVLAELHAAGWVHGDIKAGNVMVAPDGAGGERVMLIDLGLASRRKDDREAKVPADQICGTPEYMAPELTLGHAPSVASDLYAAGALLYELVAGTPPFEGHTPASILAKHAARDLPAVVERCSGCAAVPALEALLVRAMAKTPGDRFPSAEAMRDALRAVVAPLAHHTLRVPTPLEPPEAPTCPAIDDEEAEREVTRIEPATRTWRRAIGAALAAGQPQHAADAYLRLAHQLERQRRWDEARRELQEAVDLLGDAREDAATPAARWRLWLELAMLEDFGGHRAAAARAARVAFDLAAGVGDTEGMQRARRLCRRLGVEPGVRRLAVVG